MQVLSLMFKLYILKSINIRARIFSYLLTYACVSNFDFTARATKAGF